MTAHFSISQIGPLVSIQDAGRQGYMRYGVTGAGPMDRISHALANLAVNNQPEAAALEVSLGGLSLLCTEGQLTLAVAGGCFDIKLDNKSIPPWSRFTMQAGSSLSIRPGTWGSWCYVAFAGDLSSPSWLGSQSIIQGTTLCGSALQQNDVLEIKTTTSLQPGTETQELLDPARLKPHDNIRVVLGPQDRYFTDQSLRDLVSQPFTITADYNRMGIRLAGPTLTINTELDMPSAPITRGSIQVPGHGDPICLMADHQTTGGYPKIATIVSADQDRLAQFRSGDMVNFSVCDATEAVQIARQQHDQLNALTQTMKNNQVSLDERLWTRNLISGVFLDQNDA